MRLLYLLLLFLVLMSSFPTPGPPPCQHCGKSNFASDCALKIHTKQGCTKARNKIATVKDTLHKRKENQDEIARLAKRARVETETTVNNAAPSPPEDEMPDVQPVQAEPAPLDPVPEPVAIPATRPSGRPSRRMRMPARYTADFIPSALSGGRAPANLGVPATYEAPVPPPAPAPAPAPIRLPTPDPPADEAPPAKYTHQEPNLFGLFRSFLVIPAVDPEEKVSLNTLCSDASLASSAVPEPEQWRITPWGSITSIRNAAQAWFAPFQNATKFRLIHWLLTGSNQKSLAEADRLVNEVILQDDFDREDLRGFNAGREAARLDKVDMEEDEWVDEGEEGERRPSFRLSAEDGWREGKVHIRLPAEDRSVKYAKEEDAPEFEVSGIQHRRLIEVIKAVFQDTTAQKFNLIPYRLWWNRQEGLAASGSSEDSGPREGPSEPAVPAGSVPSPVTPPPDSPSLEQRAQTERVYSEVYNSEAMVGEYETLLKTHPPEPNAPYTETVIAALMFWSDSTHLAQFGNASLWPIYMFFGNQSKYERCKPSANAAHHIAYIPKLPDNFQDAYKKIFGIAATKATLQHCRRELMQAIWLLLLDDEFMEAYEHGIILRFADGIVRRVFPRIFTYAADYPEKVLLASIRYLAKCPCPRCLVEKSKIDALGTRSDMRTRGKGREDSERNWFHIKTVRTWIYTLGWSLLSQKIKDILDKFSGVPTRSAFSLRLSKFGSNYYTMFVPDLLHEFELGVWKAVFIHLLRILYAVGQDRIQELNHRYRQIPPFGRSTIQKFSNDTSGMKKLAGRDWEQMLKCSIPAFEGLLPEPFNGILLDLLFVLSSWHAYAKLRLHTSTTVAFLEDCTTTLGQLLRHFRATVCAHYRTTELPSEEAARGRRKAALAKQGEQTRPRPQAAADASRSSSTRTAKLKTINLNTYKLHALGDYGRTAVLFGPSDNYSTQTGELEHRRVKRWYARTNKHGFVQQIAKHQRRAQILEKIRRRNGAKPTQIPKRRQRRSPALSFTDSEPLPYTSPDMRYHMSSEVRYAVNITAFLTENREDPAVKDFLPRLKDHLLARLRGMDYDGDERPFSEAERQSVIIMNNTMYKHKVLRVNYTTYDVRRAQDSLNPRTQSDVMLLGHDDECDDFHPYWFARIIALYHVFAYLQDSTDRRRPPQVVRVEFAWIRWLGRDGSHASGWQARRLPRVGFVDATGNGDAGPAFGFLDPGQIIRAVHLMPAFAHGTTSELLGPSMIRRPQDPEDEDWQYFYVNIFVDRDMVMRFRGGGVGHVVFRDVSNRALSDQDLTVPEELPDLIPGTSNSVVTRPAEQREPGLEGEEGENSGQTGNGNDDASDDGGDAEDEEELEDEIEDEELEFGYMNYGDQGAGEADDADEESSSEDEDDLGAEDGEDRDDGEDEEAAY
ncbi:hypothetical protein EIP91_005233 [Steccherinum ochraceum]|uniref:Uncharacterized protein n=1 Tax=Steccherinum ochraceum TaxID=92696 RepID=A0A4R0R7R2_9APHY|nr:hypothetical protein EIP91_005233 [Steccherinum ochraceum]